MKITTRLEAAVIREALDDYLEKVEGCEYLTERIKIAERLSGEAWEIMEAEKKKEKAGFIKGNPGREVGGVIKETACANCNHSGICGIKRLMPKNCHGFAAKKRSEKMKSILKKIACWIVDRLICFTDYSPLNVAERQKLEALNEIKLEGFSYEEKFGNLKLINNPIEQIKAQERDKARHKFYKVMIRGEIPVHQEVKGNALYTRIDVAFGCVDRMRWESD